MKPGSGRPKTVLRAIHLRLRKLYCTDPKRAITWQHQFILARPSACELSCLLRAILTTYPAASFYRTGWKKRDTAITRDTDGRVRIKLALFSFSGQNRRLLSRGRRVEKARRRLDTYNEVEMSFRKLSASTLFKALQSRGGAKRTPWA